MDELIISVDEHGNPRTEEIEKAVQTVEEFKDKLRWNDLYYYLNRALNRRDDDLPAAFC